MYYWKFCKLVLKTNIIIIFGHAMESVSVYKWEKLSFGILIITSFLTVQTLQNEIKGNVVWKKCNVMLREFRILSHVSFAECVKACNVRSKCTSVKYQQRYNVCHMFATNVTDNINDLVENGKWPGTCAYVAIHRDNNSNIQVRFIIFF